MNKFSIGFVQLPALADDRICMVCDSSGVEKVHTNSVATADTLRCARDSDKSCETFHSLDIRESNFSHCGILRMCV